MKRVLFVLLLAGSLKGMDEENAQPVQQSVKVDDGKSQSPYVLAFDILDENTKVYVDTDGETLDQDMENKYLDGLCTLYGTMSYGAIDLRRLEEQIAKKRGGKKDSRFQHGWDSNHSAKLIQHETVVSPVFIKSEKQIASPCHVPVLTDGTTLRLLSNLRDRWEAIMFVSTILKPSMVGENPTINL